MIHLQFFCFVSVVNALELKEHLNKQAKTLSAGLKRKVRVVTGDNIFSKSGEVQASSVCVKAVLVLYQCTAVLLVSSCASR